MALGLIFAAAFSFGGDFIVASLHRGRMTPFSMALMFLDNLV